MEISSYSLIVLRHDRGTKTILSAPEPDTTFAWNYCCCSSIGKRCVVTSPICHPFSHVITTDHKIPGRQRGAPHTFNWTSGSFNVDRNCRPDLHSLDPDY